MAKTRLLLLGEAPLPLSPTATLAGALTRYGIEPSFSNGAELRSTREWLHLVRGADVVLCVGYDGPSEFVVRQLALAAALGRPVIRWWVGSDVLACLEDARAAANARALDRFAAANVAVASHLLTELDSLGIKAEFVPSVLNLAMVPAGVETQEIPRQILVYLPGHRTEFYGGAIVRQMAQANTDLKFIVVADHSHCLAGLPNVESLGWTDINPIYPRVGCLLRITRHDGMPRMVLEALLRGKYVIYAWPFPGCWLAKTAQDVQQCLDRFRAQDCLNLEGISAVREFIDPDPAAKMAAQIEAIVRRRLVRRRLRAAYFAGRWAVEKKSRSAAALG